jgi:hypothetical protein
VLCPGLETVHRPHGIERRVELVDLLEKVLDGEKSGFSEVFLSGAHTYGTD